MENEWILQGASGQLKSLRYYGRPGEAQKTISPVLTVADVSRRLRKSRRQVYRYLASGRLRASARILDQWLFDPEEVRRFRREALPSFLRPFFWDVRFSDLSLHHHRDFILLRLLELGDRKAIRWVFQKYPKAALVDFLESSQAARLSRQAREFLALVLGVTLRRSSRPSWRERGRHWGGIR